jgi:hypothetical protein
MESSRGASRDKGVFFREIPLGLIKGGVHRGGAFLPPDAQIEQMFGGEGGLT